MPLHENPIPTPVRGSAGDPDEDGRRLHWEGARVVRGAHSGRDCWAVTLALGVPPAGVSFRSESLSMPGKE